MESTIQQGKIGFTHLFSAIVRKVCWECENDETFSANHGKALEN